MNYLNKILSLILTLLLLGTNVSALELDLSVDDEIRKNYNPSRLETECLPPLPKEYPPTPIKTPVAIIPELQKATVAPLIQKIDKSTAVRLKKGTKIKARLHTNISDYSRVGGGVTFTSINPIYGRFITLPAGTVFKGLIIDAHPPQLSGNGGLIVIAVNQIAYKGSLRPINAKITKANNKKIFINNIKGEHKYFKGISGSLKPGTNFYKKSMRWTGKLANHPVTLILSPFTALAGVLVYGVNFIGSPVFAMFSKGGRIIIPAGSEFEIKLLEDVYLY